MLLIKLDLLHWKKLICISLTVIKFVCVRCNPGYSGPSCENKTCTLPCKNGDCVVKDGQSSCECYEGFTGNMCENGNLDACLFHHCDNNSTCKDLDAKRYTCECNTEYVFTGKVMCCLFVFC